MPCPTHGNQCAFPDEALDRCSFCHASWSKITAPATRTVVNRKGEPRVVGYLSGYGELPLNHLWRHATDHARRRVNDARWAAKQGAA